MRPPRIKVWRESAGVVSPGHAWCAVYGEYLHICDSLPELLWDLVVNFRSERNLIG